MNELCRKQIEQLLYERDRARMNGDAAAKLADDRMQKILKLEKQLEALKVESALLKAISDIIVKELFRRKYRSAPIG